MANNKQIIADTAASYSIPAYIPETIAYQESSFRNLAPYKDSNGQLSTGLFALNQAGLGYNHSPQSLTDPRLNSQIAVSHMVPAYQRGVSQGLTGFPLVEYVANNSGWPGSGGVGSYGAYDARLANSYAYVTGHTATGGTSVQGTSVSKNTSDFLTQLHDHMQIKGGFSILNPGKDASAIAIRLVLVLLALLLIIFGLVKAVGARNVGAAASAMME